MFAVGVQQALSVGGADHPLLVVVVRDLVQSSADPS